MNVYFDNNILVDIEEGVIQLERLLSRADVNYYFSEVHMDELINGLNIHPELKATRLGTLERLCGTNYIAPDVGPFKGGIEIDTPQRVFELSMQYKQMHDQLYRMANSMTIDRDGFLESLQFEKLEMGNYKPSIILNVLDERLKEYWGYGIDAYLQKSIATTGRTVYYSLFNLMDFVCYWHDKNNAARLYDSSHAYFAHYCDALVSNDKRMRVKTEAVYSYLGVQTEVYTREEFLREELEKYNGVFGVTGDGHDDEGA